MTKQIALFENLPKTIKTFSPLKSQEIEEWQVYIQKEIPFEYKQFLKETNGMKSLKDEFFLLGSDGFERENEYLQVHLRRSYMYSQKSYNYRKMHKLSPFYIQQRFIHYFFPSNFIVGGDYKRQVYFFNLNNKINGRYELVIWDFNDGVQTSFFSIDDLIEYLISKNKQKKLL